GGAAGRGRAGQGPSPTATLAPWRETTKTSFLGSGDRNSVPRRHCRTLRCAKTPVMARAVEAIQHGVHAGPAQLLDCPYAGTGQARARHGPTAACGLDGRASIKVR